MHRQLHVDMQAILDAIDGYGEDEDAFLDLRTGQVVECFHYDDDRGYDGDGGDGDGDTMQFEPEEGRHVEVPRRSAREAYRVMERFVEGLDEEEADVREQLRIALAGSGAFGRFRYVVRKHPGLRERWQHADRQDLLDRALAWLDELGIEPQYELRPLAPPAPATSPAADTAAPIGLHDLLLLGAPNGKTELIRGRVRRVLVAASPTQARKTYLRIARELIEHEGLPWRKHFVDGRDELRVGRSELSLAGHAVHLLVDVPRPVWDAFTAPPEQRAT
jgi:hypothetical protein